MTETPTTRFRGSLATIVAAEHRDSMFDIDRAADCADALAVALGGTVSLLARGDPQRIDALMVAIERRAHEIAVVTAPAARALPPFPQQEKAS